MPGLGFFSFSFPEKYLFKKDNQISQNDEPDHSKYRIGRTAEIIPADDPVSYQ